MPTTQTNPRPQDAYMAHHTSYTNYSTAQAINPQHTHPTLTHRNQPSHPPQPTHHNPHTNQHHPTRTNTLAAPPQSREMDIHGRLAQRGQAQTRSLSYSLPHKHHHLHRCIRSRRNTHNYESRASRHPRRLNRPQTRPMARHILGLLTTSLILDLFRHSSTTTNNPPPLHLRLALAIKDSPQTLLFPPSNMLHSDDMHTSLPPPFTPAS